MVVGHMFGAAACGICSLLTASFLLPTVNDTEKSSSTWLCTTNPTILSLQLNAAGLQCYGCNIIVGSRSVDTGCTSPEVITCSHSHQGFKHRFCIKMESVVLGILLTSGCATSRHCQQQELPGVRIHCCDKDLCNGSPRAPLPDSSCLLSYLLMFWMIIITFLF